MHVAGGTAQRADEIVSGFLNDLEAAALRLANNPHGEPTGHFTGRCMRCGSKDLWDDNSAYGCNCCGGWWTDIEPRLIRNGQRDV